MSIERFFLFNLLMDLTIIAAVLRGFGAFRPSRALLSSTVCALYGTLAACVPALRSPPVQLSLLAVAAALAAGLWSPGRTAAFGTSLLVSALVTGSCVQRLGVPVGLCALTVPGLFSVAVRRRVLRWAALPAEIVSV